MDSPYDPGVKDRHPADWQVFRRGAGNGAWEEGTGQAEEQAKAGNEPVVGGGDPDGPQAVEEVMASTNHFKSVAEHVDPDKADEVEAAIWDWEDEAGPRKDNDDDRGLDGEETELERDNARQAPEKQQGPVKQAGKEEARLGDVEPDLVPGDPNNPQENVELVPTIAASEGFKDHTVPIKAENEAENDIQLPTAQADLRQEKGSDPDIFRQDATVGWHQQRLVEPAEEGANSGSKEPSLRWLKPGAVRARGNNTLEDGVGGPADPGIRLRKRWSQVIPRACRLEWAWGVLESSGEILQHLERRRRGDMQAAWASDLCPRHEGVAAGESKAASAIPTATPRQPPPPNPAQPSTPP